MAESGLVRENDRVRPADFAAHLMAEAVDGAVEMIVSLMEDRKLQGLKIDPGEVAHVIGAVDDRLADADRRMRLTVLEPLAGNEEGHSSGFAQRLEMLSELRSRAEALIRSRERSAVPD